MRCEDKCVKRRLTPEIPAFFLAARVQSVMAAEKAIILSQERNGIAILSGPFQKFLKGHEGWLGSTEGSPQLSSRSWLGARKASTPATPFLVIQLRWNPPETCEMDHLVTGIAEVVH